VLAFLAAAVCGVAISGAEKPARLTIVYTSQANGQIRSCNCTKFRYGGYGREATMLAALRKEEPNLIVVEGGDMVGRPDSAQDVLKTEVAVRSIAALGYAAMVPGEAELAFGIPKLAAIKTSSAVPMVLANVKDKASGKPLCEKPYITYKTAGGLRVAVIGLMTEKVGEAMPLQEVSVTAVEPTRALKEVLPKARAAADLVLVISHAPIEESKKLAEIEGVDVILSTHSSDKPSMPKEGSNVVEMPVEKIGKCIFVQSGTRTGWSAGRLDLQIENGAVNEVQNRLFYLDQSYEESPEIVKLYDEYNERVREQVVSQQQKMRAEFLEILKKQGLDPSKRRQRKDFAGAAACRDCHKQAYDVWEKSRHAAAFDTLKKSKQEFDPECTSCHTTGSNRRGGFENAKDTPEYGSVQCEACHGPGARHAEKPAKGYGALSEELCRSCHTEAYNPDFDYEVMWKKIEH